MLNTSGTTRSQDSAVTQAPDSIRQKIARPCADRVTLLNIMPLFHIQGLSGSVAPLSGGGSVGAPGFNALKFWRGKRQNQPGHGGADNAPGILSVRKKVVSSSHPMADRSSSASLPVPVFNQRRRLWLSGD